MLRVRPLPAVGQRSEEDIKGGLRGSCLIEQQCSEPVTWLMADLPLRWRGEASQATEPRCLQLKHLYWFLQPLTARLCPAFSNMFILFFAILSSAPISCTLPPRLCSHALHILSISVALWWKIHAFHCGVVICSSLCVLRPFSIKDTQVEYSVCLSRPTHPSINKTRTVSHGPKEKEADLFLRILPCSEWNTAESFSTQLMCIDLGS